MGQSGVGEGLGDPARFVQISDGWAACLHIAESTGSRARVSEDHDGGRASAPAFTDIRAGSLLADGVKAMFLNQIPRGGKCISAWCNGTDPGGFSTDIERLLGFSLVVQDHRFEADEALSHMLARRISPKGARMPHFGCLRSIDSFGCRGRTRHEGIVSQPGEWHVQKFGRAGAGRA